jgi:hypothetical protein
LLNLAAPRFLLCPQALEILGQSPVVPQTFFIIFHLPLLSAINCARDFVKNSQKINMLRVVHMTSAVALARSSAGAAD